MRNWHTTLAGGLTALTWALSHRTLIEPLIAPKYEGIANTLFVLGIAVTSALAKDAGNHS